MTATNQITDAEFMRRALMLAARGRGLTSPNPMVGAVVVRDGAVIGEGFHARAGAAHPRLWEALKARARAPVAPRSMYPRAVTKIRAVRHQRAVGGGRCDARRGAVADPNRRAVCGVLRSGRRRPCGTILREAAAQNRVFMPPCASAAPRHPEGRLSSDGRSPTSTAAPWSLAMRARAESHRHRIEVDSIVVCVTTVLRDDPALTVRLETPWPREPYRVVLDTAARTPASARLIGGATPSRAIVAVGDAAPSDRVAALEATGAVVLRCPTREGRVAVDAVLSALFARAARAVLLEGGGEVHAAFLEAGLVDRVTLFVAPLLLGGREAPTVVGGAGRDLKCAVRLGPMSARAVGGDLLIEADVVREPR